MPSEAPIAQFDRAWAKALEKAGRGFAEAGCTDADPATEQAAAMLLLDLDETAPEGCRTRARRQCAETVRLVLEELYSGVARGRVELDGGVRICSPTRWS